MVELQSKIDKKFVAELPKVSFPGRIFVIYTEAEARKAIDYLNTHVLVGVDTETRPSFRKGAVNKVALLQMSTYDTCILFRFNIFFLLLRCSKILSLSKGSSNSGPTNQKDLLLRWIIKSLSHYLQPNILFS